MPDTGMTGNTSSVEVSMMNAAPATPLAPFEVSIATTDQRHFLREGQLDIEGLRDEEDRHRQIDVGAIEIERIASRNDQPDYRLGAAQAFEFFEHPAASAASDELVPSTMRISSRI